MLNFLRVEEWRLRLASRVLMECEVEDGEGGWEIEKDGSLAVEKLKRR